MVADFRMVCEWLSDRTLDIFMGDNLIKIRHPSLSGKFNFPVDSLNRF